MVIRLINLHPFVTAVLLCVGLSLPAWAQSDLDALYDELKTAEPLQSQRITREIERLWALSGSTSVDMLLRRGREAMDDNDVTTAIEHLTAVTDHAPDFAEGWHARATAYFRKDLYGPALDDLQKALILNPRHYNAMFGLGIMLQEFGDYTRAAEAFRAVLDLHPHHENATSALERLKQEGIGREL